MPVRVSSGYPYDYSVKPKVGIPASETVVLPFPVTLPRPDRLKLKFGGLQLLQAGPGGKLISIATAGNLHQGLYGRHRGG